MDSAKQGQRRRNPWYMLPAPGLHNPGRHVPRYQHHSSLQSWLTVGPSSSPSLAPALLAPASFATYRPRPCPKACGTFTLGWHSGLGPFIFLNACSEGIVVLIKKLGRLIQSPPPNSSLVKTPRRRLCDSLYFSLGLFGYQSHLVPKDKTLNLAIQSTSLWSQAQPSQGSPDSAATDSTGGTPNSPRTPLTPSWSSHQFSLQKPSITQGNKPPSLTEAGEGQCAGPRGQVCTGDLAPMSQTGPTSRHASRRSSRSPVGDDQVSPSSTRYGPLGNRDLPQDLTGVPYTNGDNRIQQVPARTIGVHTILNPLEPQLLGSGGGAVPFTARPSDPEMQASAPGSTPGSFPANRLFPAGQTASISLPGTPVGPMTPLGGTSSERNSPTMAFPFPAMHHPRRKPSLTQSPRAMSISQGQPVTREPPSLPSVSPAKRPYENESPEEVRSQFPGLHHLPGMPTGPPSAMSTPGRSLSQPAILSPGAQAPPNTLTPSNAPSRLQQHSMPPQTSYPPNVQPSRPFPTAGPPSDGSSPWSETIRRHGMGGPLFGVEGQQAFMTLPGSDTPIPVQVDYSQASKKADEKRQRNAVASTRHRRKKKIMQEENTKQLQELRDERRMMEIQIEEVKQQRDFYREDRNRLRDIVAQTPSISSLAVGPQSPTFQTSSSYADSSSLQGYGGDPSTGERPAQRRRTDDRPEFSIPSYGSPASVHPGASPGGLPPMQGPGYGAPSRPSSAASSTGGERLPPLRAMEGRPPPGPGQGQVQEQDLRTGQWVSAQPRMPETGWATRDTHRRL
ncbi:hypothetical protein FALBO_6002 [Fusarium albosuccineum]|uniref:BZIP domain-containing protein n=1 Tax=Fusarium albosuccineum TaxID=1237068 RepID=A0A8H4P9A3_9HYPO|nr:hypothetical protein FALBO_6002 [Fusarium albosuccineum]